MAAFGLVQKEYASLRGVAMEPSAFGPASIFTILKEAQLTRRARWEGGEQAMTPGGDIMVDTGLGGRGLSATPLEQF